MDRAEAVDPRAAEQAHEDRFGLIAGVVGGGDGVAGVVAGQRGKGGVALAACQSLEVASRLAQSGTGREDGNRHVVHAQEIGQFPRLGGVGLGLGLGAQVVDDVGQNEAIGALLCGRRGGEGKGQGAGISPGGAGQEGPPRGLGPPRQSDGSDGREGSQARDEIPVHGHAGL